MKYKILISIVVVALAAILSDYKHEAHSQSAGAVPGTTGSPSDGTTCANAGCHTGSAVIAETGWITSNIPAAGYTPGTAYTITATATTAALLRFGFQISPQSANGSLVGTMTAGTGNQVLTGGKYITHTSAGTLGTTGSHTWAFTWTAPAYGTGSFNFYGAFNCSNDNSSSSGDVIHTSSLAVNEAPTAGLDCGIYSITNPNGFDCTGNITPIVVLRNYGTTPLTSATINYQVDAGTVSTYNWAGTLASQTSVAVTLPAIASAAGAHTFTAYTSAPNASTDLIATNDSKISNYTTTTPTALPFNEGFEGATFPPAGWIISNPDNLTTWAKSTAAFAGTGSAYMDNYNYNGAGQRDGLTTPPMNLSTAINPNLTFEVAYEPYSTTSNLDSLMVFISTDCGVSWTSIYSKYGTTLASVATALTSAFTPTTAQWRLETVSLSPYQTSSTALFKFVNGCQYGNDVYIDNVSVAGAAGIDTYSNIPTINLYPNPIKDVLTVEYSLPQSSSVSVKMYDLQGREVAELISEKSKTQGKYKATFDMKDYKQGMYFVNISAGGTVSTQKVMVVH